MRHVDIEELKLPKGWKARAEAAAKAVDAGGDPEDYANVWRVLKDRLADLLPEKKCWYCEVAVDRADNAVDHYRPKGRVSDAAKEHKGYRWLAFEPSNFRYSCTWCNSRRKGVDTAGGKGDRFPLVYEPDRRYSKTDVGPERPALLDPCDLDDWKLLGCRQESGESCPASTNKVDIDRAEQSIKITISTTDRL
ncbi:hypothetical protein [Aminobacter sp. MET-1]|uniref:hypothetical protein n=1 Tax=Aminobacter sp. MET-1 TaxID=2951085 RepID=UPI00226A297B|nr:hypothetical protein [Aminobacter sp. MET-1]MCX8568789.1 hypothetical protein [Aminobacter sp. MET-1]